MIVSKMKSIKNDVRELLMRYPDCRDNDSKLIAIFYYKVYGGKEVFAKTNAETFLKDFANKKLPFPDTITRVRRKLQEQNVELRGEKYKERHGYENETRKDIHKL